MKYTKPQVEVVNFESEGFMTASSEIDWSNMDQALATQCSGVSPQNGKYDKVDCGVFGGYSNVPNGQHVTVVVGDGIYVYDHTGNHWKCTNYKK